MNAPAGGLLINIDNGGTLTDICVIDGARVHRTKTLTTPHDLSQCLMQGLQKASRALYGKEDLLQLLLATDCVRYSTTQGTNALVERKGPRIGLILGGGLDGQRLRGDSEAEGVYTALIGSRVRALDAALDGEALGAAAVHAVNALAAAGANRIVVSFAGAQRAAAENAVKRKLLRTFPPHLLGALPILYAHELVEDADDVRRTWTAAFNAFLHPAMERFLYSAEHKLREYRARNPLLVFRNDGFSARVAKTVAVKTYSSGPRGGMEGAKALAAHYGFKRLLTMDVGGTTTDIGLIENGAIRARPRGEIEGVITSLPLCDVVSTGVGGSSIFTCVERALRVGPESVGSAPGPACFGLGGREATMTDAFLLAGLLDPASYFGGELRLDAERARRAIGERIATPLAADVEAALARMERAWVGKIVDNLRRYTDIDPDMVLAAFGGAGPLVACRIADELGIRRVVIPGLAAVFSAYGIGFSDIGHEFVLPLASNDVAGLAAARAVLIERARRGMYAEGAELAECRIEETLSVFANGEESTRRLEGATWPDAIPTDAQLSLKLLVVKPVSHAKLCGRFGAGGRAAVSEHTRRILCDGTWREVPLYRVERQQAGARADGLAVLEEAFFTARIDAGWSFEINDAGDILLRRSAEGRR